MREKCAEKRKSMKKPFGQTEKAREAGKDFCLSLGLRPKWAAF